MIHIHGFDWEAYTTSVMPAFAQWLLEGDESQIYHLYARTRNAHEEEFIPPAMRDVCTWTRARTFVKQLPQSIHTQYEYHILCNAEAFTKISDHYIHKHPPQIYPQTDTLRTIWGCIVEEYCQAWLHLPQDQDEIYHPYEIGQHPNPLRLRGWLSTISLRAMALFELLVCGRRSMPFGYRSDEPYENYIGYLTPDEVLQLAQCLQCAQVPQPQHAEQDYQQFRQQQEERAAFHMLDEVSPTHADVLITAVHLAAQSRLGLIANG